MLELAYRLAASETPMIRGIGNKLVVLINPVSNPDGRDKVEWFYRYLKGKTDRASLPRMSPPYWSKYAFVDINRDDSSANTRDHQRLSIACFTNGIPPLFTIFTKAHRS